ncbi:MAG: type II restriction endonuclease [Vicinamibacterales bacterium]
MIAGLSGIVTGVAVKRLAAVEAMPSKSNQHEINGVQPLKAMFGEKRTTFRATFVYLGSDDQETARSIGFVTWYDAREDHPSRSEFRLYFPATAASERLTAGDSAFVLTLGSGDVLVAFVAEGSTAERQLSWLFDLESPRTGVSVADLSHGAKDVGFAAREVLSQLGIETPAATPDEESDLGELLERFGGAFPSTREFSAFARDKTDWTDDDPDETIVAWLEREEALFRQLERHIVLKRLRQGFGEDVDEFIAYSLSVQNRRKSRVGHAIENHLEALFSSRTIRYSRGQVTERASRPDFVFPSIKDYRDFDFPAGRLTMLGVKSTCKDRWRQVLAEADRVPRKHLFTLEPAISTMQTSEMRSRSVVLVMPAALHATFDSEQRADILSVRGFLGLLAERQQPQSA